MMAKAAAKDAPPILSLTYSPQDQAFGRPHSTDQRDLVRRYKAWVHHCAWINATAVSQWPLKLYLLKQAPTSVTVPTRAVDPQLRAHIRRGPWLGRKGIEDFDQVTEHQALTLLAHPNEYMTGRELLQLIELYLGLTGCAYVLKQRGPLSIVTGLWPLPAQRIRVITGSRRIIDGYWLIKSGTEKIRLRKEDVIRFRRPNPLDPYLYGMGEGESEMSLSWLNEAIDQYEVRVFKRQGRPDGVLERRDEKSPRLTGSQMKEALKNWYRVHGWDGDGPGGIAVLNDLKFTAFPVTPRDVSYLNAEKKVMLRIANAYGIPISMLTTEDVNKANALAGERQHAKHTVIPRQRYIEEVLTEEWVIEYDPRLFLAFDDPTPSDEEIEYKRDVEYVRAGIRAVDEVRADHNWEPMPEEYKRERLEQQQAAQPPAPEEGDEKPEKPPPKKALNQAIPQPHAVGGEHIERYARALRSLFARQEHQLLGEAKSVKASEADEILAGARYSEALTARLGDLRESWEHELYGASRGHIELSMEIGAARGLADLRKLGATLETSFDVTTPEVAGFIDDYTGMLAKGITDTQDAALRKALRTGLEEGASIPKIRDHIREVFQSSKLRATNIARSETSRAVHGGQKEEWKKSRLVEKITWLTADDPCAYCSSLNGETISINDNFRELGGSIEAEGETPMPVTWMSIGTPPAHPMCRCTMLPELVQV
jgi:HK97 family phage portal protein